MTDEIDTLAKQVNFRLTPSEAEELKELCEYLNVSVSDLLRHLLRREAARVKFSLELKKTRP